MRNALKTILPALVITATTGLLVSVPLDGYAAGGICSNCHVMHASESGANPNASGVANNTLLRDTCLGCHTQDNGNGNDGILDNDEPGVLKKLVAAAAINTLAGGNYDYSKTDQTYGHNPIELGAADTRNNGAPPGFVDGVQPSDGSAAVGGGAADWTSNDLSCSGVYGCHGEHVANGMNGAHHSNATGADVDGSTVGKSYRFLLGIDGWEDTGYELNPAATAGEHNIYYAVDRLAADGDDATSTANNKLTISYFCSECHGMFHSGAGNDGVSSDGTMSSTWVRHPVDIVMPTVASASGDFDAYNAYDLDVPVGSNNVGDNAVTVTNAGDRIVMCLSCHRAHASPYPAALRWDYNAMIAGGGGTGGCFACHDGKS